ncbi:hypothetical protein LWI29_012483 [Acer saccharum]|uniref:SAM-dependent MTase DRM-type domain-containing protein n=1 Tax=Acer saccharum TaxID=4024 RepID=A0AA39TQ18_ACESA|nr:hypothetical protein LWI29_012483 [Acer saccharum]
MEYCKKHVESSTRAVNDDLKAWDAEFVKVDQATLFDLIRAAHYLIIKSLSELTCKIFVDMFTHRDRDNLLHFCVFVFAISGKMSGNKDKGKAVDPKPERLDSEFPDDTLYSTQVGNNVASSSGSILRSSFITMGFAPSLVDQVIDEKGEDDADLILETLFKHSGQGLQSSDAQSSDSLESLFGDLDDTCASETSTVIQPKLEPDAFDANNDDDDKRATLLIMNFSVDEVDSALDKLGFDAPVNELVDFILAAQIAAKFDKETDDMPHEDEPKTEGANDEILYATMQKTLQLLEMGFSENEISLAIEKFGSEAPIAGLAESICLGDLAPNERAKNSSKAFTTNLSRMGMENGLRHQSYGGLKIKTEDIIPDIIAQSSRMNTKDTNRGQSSRMNTEDTNRGQSSRMNTEDTNRGKRPKEEYFDDFPNAAASQIHILDFGRNHKKKRPKQGYMNNTSSVLDSAWLEEKVKPNLANLEMQIATKSNPCRSIPEGEFKPPYFFYGNVFNLPSDTWTRISQYLSTEPELVNTQFYSALSRREAYVHNLPRESRFIIVPKSAMTIQDAIPNTKKWWPSWDTRKQLSCLSSGISGIVPLCARLGQMITNSRGVLSSEQQKNILHHCGTSNLVWVGKDKLGPLAPEHLEIILGYPMNHTQAAEWSLAERLESLRYCIQTDTLGFHLSVLKAKFPEGITMLSVFSGIGGAEVTLHRLGIHLKGVISIESSETNRKILRRWWQTSGQTGELVQLEDIQTLTTKKLLNLIQKFVTIDFVICQNQCPSSSKRSVTAAQCHCFRMDETRMSW